MWFSSSPITSKESGFQQIFLNPQNWLYFAEQERRKYIQYTGYSRKLALEKVSRFHISPFFDKCFKDLSVKGVLIVDMKGQRIVVFSTKFTFKQKI